MRLQRWTILVSALTGCLLSVPVSADEAGIEEQQLELSQKAVDRESARRSDPATVKSLSQQFGVEPDKIDALRKSGEGWGAITNELALAQELQKKDPTTYPTMTAALDKVQTLRSEKKGLGVIAKELGIKLGPVVSAARHTRNELRRQARSEMRTQRMQRTGRPDAPPHPETPSRPERPSHPDRPGRSR